MTAALASEGKELRLEVRTNLYLAASLRWSGGATPVRIRNLSPRGALVEAPTVPLVGTAVELVRGNLRVHGRAAWSSGNRAGLRLGDLITVREWMGHVGTAGQQRVDGLVRAIRSGDLPPPQAPRASLGSADPAGDLRLACRLLEQLGDALVTDLEVVASHGRALQSLDVVQQLLDALARSGTEPSDQGARLADLRASAAAALAG